MSQKLHGIAAAAVAVTVGWSMPVFSAQADNAAWRAEHDAPVEVCEAFPWDVPIEQMHEVDPSAVRRTGTAPEMLDRAMKSNLSRFNRGN